MRVPQSLGSFAAALACINLLIPLPLLQAADTPLAPVAKTTAPLAAKVVTRDVALSETRELRGRMVDKNGQRVGNRTVVAVHSDKSSLQTMSDANGEFRFVGAKPGVYQIASQRSYQVCRCWAANTAPPAATQQLLVVEGDETLRGQKPVGELLCGPVLIGLLIAAAIVIPIAVHNSQKSAS